MRPLARMVSLISEASPSALFTTRRSLLRSPDKLSPRQPHKQDLCPNNFIVKTTQLCTPRVLFGLGKGNQSSKLFVWVRLSNCKETIMVRWRILASCGEQGSGNAQVMKAETQPGAIGSVPIIRISAGLSEDEKSRILSIRDSFGMVHPSARGSLGCRVGHISSEGLSHKCKLRFRRGSWPYQGIVVVLAHFLCFQMKSHKN